MLCLVFPPESSDTVLSVVPTRPLACIYSFIFYTTCQEFIDLQPLASSLLHELAWLWLDSQGLVYSDSDLFKIHPDLLSLVRIN